MKNYVKKVLGILIVCTLCIGGMPQAVNAATTINPGSVTVSYVSQSGSFSVSSNETWNAVATASWIRITKSGYTVKYELTQNNSTMMRTGTVIIYGNGRLAEFIINQKPYEKSQPQPVTGSFSVPGVSGNWYPVATASWIRVTKIGSSTVKYELTANTSGTTRSADVICIGDKGPFYTYKVVQD